MTYAGPIESPNSTSSTRLFVSSYDLGYEFSQQHYIELECMVEDADGPSTLAAVPEMEEVAS